jgi:putative ABC transport system permease protein
MSGLGGDLRYALRMLWRAPGVTVTALAALGLGIGGSVAIFSVVDAVLLRPLPYRAADRLAEIFGNFHAQNLERIAVSVPEYLDYRAQSQVLEDLTAFAVGDSNLTGGGSPERVSAAMATSSFLGVFGVEPALGRGFSAEEQSPGRSQVALLSHGLWQRRFGGDPAVVGKSLLLDGLPYAVVGVLPRGFRMTGDPEVFVPLPLTDALKAQRGARWLRVVGRLRPGQTVAALSAEMDVIARRLQEAHPDNYRAGVGWAITVVPLLDQVVGRVRPALWVLLGAVALVLLIACANVASLLLTRATGRAREFAIRTALGARRLRLFRQLLCESLLLSLGGGALGLLGSLWGVDLLLALAPSDLPRLHEVAISGRVLAFALGVSVATGLCFGVVPALASSRPDITSGLKEGSRGTASGARHRLRRALVAGEVALALVLCVGAGLLLRSFAALVAVDPGFRADGVLTLRVSMPTPAEAQPSVADGVRYAAYYQRAAQRLLGLPGVTAVSGISVLPLSGDSTDSSYDIENYLPRDAGDRPDNEVRVVLPGYFRALGIPLLAGREVGPDDGADSPKVVVVNQALARRYFGDAARAVGRRLRLHRGGDRGWRTIVGVVGDVHDVGLDARSRPEMYYPASQLTEPSMTFVLHAAGPPAALASAARAALAEVDRDQPIFEVRPLADVVANSLGQRRFALILLGLFAACALALAALGVYGVMAYSVAQRTQEIGIRLALGAQRGDVLGLVVRQGMQTVAIGLLVGTAIALSLSRALATLVWGVSPRDPLTYAALAALLSAVALLATLLPAWRAARTSPMVALRAE